LSWSGVSAESDSAAADITTKQNAELAAVEAASPPQAEPSFQPPQHATTANAVADLHQGDVDRLLDAPPTDAAVAVARELELDAQRAEHNTAAQSAVGPSLLARVGNLPITLLRAVNAPVAGLGEDAREMVGAIAIVTLVNAMSILLYVMIYR
jgi:hypothetical protein